jgi:hypothetical protein
MLSSCKCVITLSAFYLILSKPAVTSPFQLDVKCEAGNISPKQKTKRSKFNPSSEKEGKVASVRQ